MFSYNVNHTLEKGTICAFLEPFLFRYSHIKNEKWKKKIIIIKRTKCFWVYFEYIKYHFPTCARNYQPKQDEKHHFSLFACCFCYYYFGLLCHRLIVWCHHHQDLIRIGKNNSWICFFFYCCCC